MTETVFLVLLLALVLDWHFGEPAFLWSRLPHPVVVFGQGIGFMDRRFNRPDLSSEQRYKNGSLGLVALLLLVLVIALAMEWLFDGLGIFGFALECMVVFTLLAQHSLYHHVRNVAVALHEDGVEAGREKVRLIVGRDPASLDESGICRASIETLAENFSDGVVAPAFWYLIFGLPGILIYKMVNTADSMIGYRNERYLQFGRTAAQMDDLINWVPARMSAGLIALGIGFKYGISRAGDALKSAFQDAGLHRSPNAGWPEAAMAGGTGLALGGPRKYHDAHVPQSYLNATGKRELAPSDIFKCLAVFRLACFCGWGVCGVGWIIAS